MFIFINFHKPPEIFQNNPILGKLILPDMSAKTVFVIIVTVLVTIVLMKNTDEVSFWIFGDAKIPKLAILGVMFGLGLILGYMAGRPGKKQEIHEDYSDYKPLNEEKRSSLSDEDRDYIN